MSSDSFWVLLQLRWVGYFLPWNNFWEVVLWSSLCFVYSNIPEGTVCVLRVGVFFFSLLNFTSWLLLTVTPVCQRSSSQYYCVLTGSYFHSASRAKAGWGEDLHIDAYSWLLAHPLVCFCREPDRLIQKLLVLNNDMQLLRMFMSFPVFVRSYLVLLWKLNVILNPHPPPLCFSPWLLWFQKKSCLFGRVRPPLQL